MRLLILGCGLAGAAVAWAAHRRGWFPIVIDRVDLESSSHVAAGLVTPITGTRSAATWRWESFLETAFDHYTFVEEQTDSHFWRFQPALRLFQSSEERERAVERWSTPSPGLASRWAPRITLCTPQEIAGWNAPYGGCWMEPAARLDTTPYLESTRNYFLGRDQFIAADLAVHTQLVPSEPSDTSCFQVQFSDRRVDADALVFCQGFEARTNSWFSGLPLHPARGDILTLSSLDEELPVLCPSHVVHSEAWMVPTTNRCILVGATYDRHHLDGRIGEDDSTLANRKVLLDRMERMLPSVDRARWKLERQRAAVRPASYDRHPLIGRHPVARNAYVLNGLGSKGTLMAPQLAELLCDAIQSGGPIDPSLNWQRRHSQNASNREELQ